MKLITDDLKRRAEKLREARAAWRVDRPRIEPVVRAILADAPAANVSVSDMGKLSTVDVRISGPGGLFVAAVRALRTRGWTTVQPMPEAGTTSWGGFWSHDRCDMQIWLSFCSTTCRRVQIGTETVERAIYKTVCDDGAEAAS